MFAQKKYRHLYLAGSLLFGSIAPGAALAQTYASTPSGINETQGATSGLGSSHRFASTDGASAHCPGDIIVWSAGPGLTYALPSTANYGKGHGFYACKEEADDAGFQTGD